MLEAGPPPGLLICFLPVFCKGALGFWSLGTDNFITNGGGGGFFLRKQFMSMLVEKIILFPFMSKQNKV
jgi:hypothetical protein